MLQPEYYPATNTVAGLGPARILSGSDAQRMQVFFGTFTAGVYQQVSNLAAGQSYTFGAQVYVWSSSFDDPNLSQQDGGVTVQVGFDPAGGANPESASIVWSDFVAPRYDSWVYYSVQGVPQSASATVWIRATVSTPVKHNVLFFDDALLVLGTGMPPSIAPGTPVPTTAVPSATPLPPSATPQPTNTSLPPTATVTPSATFTPTITLTPSPYPTVDNTAFPARIFYTVQQGDTVQLIAISTGSSIDAIIATNNLSPEGLIFVGQVLVVPVTVNGVPPTMAPPTAVAPTTVPPTVAPPTAAPTPVPVITYVVRPGDTLFGIALRFNTTVGALQRANNIANPNLIFAGQRLIIPQPGPVQPIPTAITLPGGDAETVPLPPTSIPTLHVVQPGDNLYTLAIRFDTTVSALVSANDIANPNLIFVGQTLIIP
jgi:LysM repeat protein